MLGPLYYVLYPIRIENLDTALLPIQVNQNLFEENSAFHRNSNTNILKYNRNIIDQININEYNKSQMPSKILQNLNASLIIPAESEIFVVVENFEDIRLQIAPATGSLRFQVTLVK